MPRIFDDIERSLQTLSSGLGTEPPPADVPMLGDPAILARPKLAMFCSVKCPGRLILGAYDFAQALRQGSWAVVGGFHSPMEKEWLGVLLRGPEALVLCVARPLEGIRVAADWRTPMEEGRLAIVSSASGEKRRLTAEGAQDRNRFSAALWRTPASLPTRPPAVRRRRSAGR